jgi:hypothetical protein
MHTVYVDPQMSDDDRRERLYDGDLFVLPPTAATLAYVDFTRELVEEAFTGKDPQTAQYDMPVEDYAALLAELKPRFIHHPESKRHLRGILQAAGCDPDLTYFDVPRLRTSTSDNYLTTGIAFAFHPHRDTWYSAPLAQLNWWMPVYDVSPNNCLAFHPRYWRHGVANGSAAYNYQEWDATSRKVAAQQIGVDTRKQPTPEEPIELDPQLKIICPVGGIVLFSGSQLHSSVPNDSGRTRFSIDFRTVHIGDLRQLRGAPNLDARCTGTTMADYMRISDLSHIPDDVVATYMPGHPQSVRSEPVPSPIR